MFKYSIFFTIFLFTSCIATEVAWKGKLHYDTPEFYMINGEQTEIHNERWKEEILEKFSQYPSSLEQLITIQDWIRNSFKFNRGYGVTIGSVTSEEIYASKEVRGGHDISLIFSSIIRQLGYPCIFVETTSVMWSKTYAQGMQSEARGHVFVEILLDGQWILFDPCTGFCLVDYDCQNPYIFIDHYKDESDGFYVLGKGKDNWDLGIYCLDDLLKIQHDTAVCIFKNID